MVAFRKPRIDVGLRRGIVFQHAHQPAAAQVARQVPLRALQDAPAGQAPGQRHFPVVAAEVAAHLHGFAAAAFREAPQSVGGLVLAQHDALVPRQVMRRGRHAVRGPAGVGDAGEALDLTATPQES
ncbi:hypothetical protein G6F40_013609 [Rhizopus arrhizus]|nr:hypothetical protein G6F40_013609 [Rhizopus arrhizus]